MGVIAEDHEHDLYGLYHHLMFEAASCKSLFTRTEGDNAFGFAFFVMGIKCIHSKVRVHLHQAKGK